MLLMSLGALVCAADPLDGRYDVAISFQLAAGSLTAILLFALMALILIYFGVRLWFWGNTFSSIGAVLIAAAVGLMAFTNPFSAVHNLTFSAVTWCIVFGNAALYWSHLDIKLLPGALY